MTITVRLKLFAAGILCMMLLAAAADAADPARYAGCDLRVLYLYEDAEQIDWPSLLYLNDEIGCRIDVVSFHEAGAVYSQTREVPGRHMYRHDLYAPAGEPSALDSALGLVLAERNPDVVLFGPSLRSGIAKRAKAALLDRDSQNGTTTLFPIQKMYQQVGSSDESWSESAVTMAGRELASRYKDRLQLDIPQLFPRFSAATYVASRLTRYEPISIRVPSRTSDPSLVAGLSPMRLERAIDSLMTDSKVRDALTNRARNIVSFFGAAESAIGRARVENIIRGYKELLQLHYQARSSAELAGNPEFMGYLYHRLMIAKEAGLQEMGLEWDGRIFVRESPHGPKVKFRARVAVNGPQEVELSYIRFLPYWDTTAIVLDSVSRKIRPHQSYEREYLVDVEASYLEASRPESLLFSAEIVYSQIPMQVTSAMPVWASPEMSVAFQPDFNFIPPSAQRDVNEYVSSMNWKVLITKPSSYQGPAKLTLEVPRGLFAGAYRQELELPAGRVHEVVRIPFSASNLFDPGVQHTSVSLTVNERVVASDTANVRIAACEINSGRSIAFLPDSLGYLEDILRMSQATARPLTDRGLWTADLDEYDVIVIGSGAARQYPSLADVRGRLEEYIRNGGSIVLLGQPYDWPKGILPMTVSPSLEPVTGADIDNRIPGANVLSSPYRIDTRNLLADIAPSQPVASAVVAPSERVFVTTAGGTLLSVSRLGDGQLIYCGLPLTELIAGLNLEAIHLFANLLNY